jgi:cation diffusion facilitator family transporter
MQRDQEANGSQLEINVFRLSLAIGMLSGIIGGYIAWRGLSITIFVDSAYSFFSVLVDFIALTVAHKLCRSKEQNFNFGYYKLEPIVVNLESILIISIAVVAVTLSAVAFMHGGEHSHYELAIAYAGVAAIICFSMNRLCSKAQKQTGSKILFADAKVWRADGLVSAAAFVGFSLALLTKDTPWFQYARFVDPILACGIAIFIVREPIKMIRESFMELLDTTTNTDLEQQIDHLVREVFSSQQKIQLSKVKTNTAGRHINIHIGYDLPEMIARKDLDACNSAIREALEQQFRSVSVNFYVHG